MNTSGILLEENKDGSIKIGYVDYDVDFFNGSDYESFYVLDKENADKLKKYCMDLGYLNLLDALVVLIGNNFDDVKFQDCCKKANVKYEHLTWH